MGFSIDRDFVGCLREDFNFFGLLTPLDFGGLGLVPLELLPLGLRAPFGLLEPSLFGSFGLVALFLRDPFGLMLSDLLLGLVLIRLGLPLGFLGLVASAVRFGERFGERDLELCTSTLITLVFCLPSSFTVMGW